MMDIHSFQKQLFNINNEEEFEKLALMLFVHQYNQIPIYKEFCEHLGRNDQNVQRLADVPFLPIEFYKSEKILSGDQFDQVFMSSGTQEMGRSKHYVKDIQLYEESFRTSYEAFIGEPSNQVILSLLPSYRDNGDSSLIYMIDRLQQLGEKESKEVSFDELSETLQELKGNNKEVVLFGVAYALIDLMEHIDFALDHVSIVETGGMKGKRKEITREELHQTLEIGLKPKAIFSEYGMTELLSQAYSKNNEGFQCPAWMKVFIRDLHDPLTSISKGTGGINVIDLANVHSCSFIATSDLGRWNGERFEVLGRFDYSDIRGCNLLYQS